MVDSLTSLVRFLNGDGSLNAFSSCYQGALNRLGTKTLQSRYKQFKKTKRQSNVNGSMFEPTNK